MFLFSRHHASILDLRLWEREYFRLFKNHGMSHKHTTNMATLNIPIIECGKLMNVIQKNLRYDLVPPKDLESFVHLGTWHLSTDKHVACTDSQSAH